MSEEIRILLLEDDPADAEMLERLLARANVAYSVKCVSSESAFRREVLGTSYDVVLADYRVPGFSGMDALRITRELMPDLPFIFFSGAMGEDQAVAALRDGATDYVLKDRPERLPTALRRALDERRETELRRKMQEALIRSEQRFHFAAQATLDVIWDWDAGEERVWISDAITSVWGHHLDDPMVDFEWWMARVHPDDRERLRESLRKAIEEGAERVIEEYRFQCADGSYGSVYDRAVITRREDGAARVIGAMQDITSRVEAERAIRDMSRANEVILGHAADGILALDRAGRLVFANPAAMRLLRWEGRITKGEPAHAALHDCDLSDRCPILASFIAPASRHAHDRFRRDAGTFSVEATFSPILEADQVTGCVIVFQDIEERTRLEKQLEQTRRVGTLGQIAATSAHEFNNVLMGILPFAEILRKHATEPLMVKCATQIVSSVSRGRRITQDILRTTNMVEPVLQAIDVGDWLRQIEGEMAAMAGAGVKVRIDAPRAALAAVFDTGHMHQVISNLVVNARDAMSGAGTITISATRHPEQPSVIRMDVADTGTGIAPENLSRIFEPLYTTKRTGTGLGLSVVQQLVERNHGRLSVRSEVGVGTTFSIVLPAAEETAHPDHPEEIGLRQIMIVDDDEIVADGISAMLDLHGLSVEVVHRGLEVEDAVERYHPSVVLLDVNLPDLDGTEVYERLSSRWPDLPVIFSSGDTSGARVTKYVSRPNVRFLRKPYDTDALLQAIAELTESGSGHPVADGRSKT